MNKFEELYKKIAVSSNYNKPNHPRLGNWAIDRYEAGEWFACISDGGYSRYIGKSIDGKVVWRVNDYYPNPLEYSGITEEEFNKLVDEYTV